MSVTRLVPIPAGCAALLAILVYLNALDNPFVYDDFRLIVENPALVDPGNLAAILVRDIARPIVNLSFAFDTAVWGRGPVGFHVTSVLLHALNVVLLFWVAFLAAEDSAGETARRAWRGLPSTVVGLATATVFAVHPLMTQAVGYIASRSEVTYATFFLLALLAGRRWLREGGARWWFACIGCWALALMAKETAGMLPLVLIAYDLLVLDADAVQRRRRFMRLHLPILALMTAAGAARLLVLTRFEYGGEAAADARFGVLALDAFSQYLAIVFAPRGQTVFHEPVMVGGLRAAAALLVLAAFAAAAWRLRRVHSLLAFGLIWFFVLLIPSAVLTILGRAEPMAEHRAYLPAAGLFLTWGCAFAALWMRAGAQRPLVAATAAIFVASLAVLTVVRNVVWDDPVALAQEAVTRSPHHWIPRLLVAETMRQNGRCGEAVAEYREVIAMRPNDDLPYAQLARCFIETRQLVQAEATLRKVRTMSDNPDTATMGLALVAVLRSRPGEARYHLDELLERDPAHVQGARLLAFIDGRLPPAERARMCAELRTAAGGELTLDACRN